jgi:hypothetical protein
MPTQVAKRRRTWIPTSSAAKVRAPKPPKLPNRVERVINWLNPRRSSKDDKWEKTSNGTNSTAGNATVKLEAVQQATTQQGVVADSPPASTTPHQDYRGQWYGAESGHSQDMLAGTGSHLEKANAWPRHSRGSSTFSDPSLDSESNMDTDSIAGSGNLEDSTVMTRPSIFANDCPDNNFWADLRVGDAAMAASTPALIMARGRDSASFHELDMTALRRSSLPTHEDPNDLSFEMCDDWVKISEVRERRRIQHRINQRTYRT